jgi:uncharacterized membrane protein YccF (DUF307 family)
MLGVIWMVLFGWWMFIICFAIGSALGPLSLIGIPLCMPFFSLGKWLLNPFN